MTSIIFLVTARQSLSEPNCQIAQVLAMPVTVDSGKPLVTAKVNGQIVQFVIDSGAFYSLMSAASAAQLHLPLRDPPRRFSLVRGVGGTTPVKLTTVENFELGDRSFGRMDLLVGGSEVGRDAVGVIGQNVFGLSDVEYDLANGVIRILRTTGCGTQSLAYWSKPGDALAMLPVDGPAALQAHIAGVGQLNGKNISITFDTGTSISILSMRAAAYVGITPKSPGVVRAGVETGIGTGSTPSYVGRFDNLSIGGEKIKNARLRFGDLQMTDMLVGADFFLSHRVYVSASQHRMYFTYNGGPVFDLRSVPPENQSIAREPSTPAVSADVIRAPTPDGTPDALPDADFYSRRAAALASRKDLDHALTDLTQAIDMQPAEARYLYQRAVVYTQKQQITAALGDLDKAVLLAPDLVTARLMRAEIRLLGHQESEALEDLDAVDRNLAREADLRFSLAMSYERASRPNRAIEQLSEWLDFHPLDARSSSALAKRCEMRALEDVELTAALADCDKALKRAAKNSPFEAEVLRNRGLVKLRLSDYNQSAKDFNASLKIDANDPWSLFGRGLDYLRLSKPDKGKADLLQATTLRPQIAETFSRYGLYQ